MAAVDQDSGRDCCGACCSAIWAAAAAVMAEAGLAEDSAAAVVEAGLAALVEEAQAAADRLAVIRKRES